MANERNNTALEFETMLRRHLKSGGAPVAACAGFDFDAASAYLEDALGQSHRAGYESHLAGCATCRRHLIELSRLAQTAPHAGTQPSTVADRTPAWARWRGVAAGWFDLSSWNSKWRMTGIAGAAFAILIAALGVQSWLQTSKQNELARAVGANATVPMESTTPALTPEASPQAEPLHDGLDTFADRGAQSPRPVPTPQVGPSVGDIAVASAPPTESARLKESPQSVFDSQRVDAAAGTPLQGRAVPPFIPTQTANSPGIAGNQAAGGLGGLGRFANQELANQEMDKSRITPPGINQANTGPVDLKVRPTAPPGEDQKPQTELNAQKPDPEPPGKTATDKSRLSKSLAYIADMLNPLPPIKPDINKEARTLVPGTKPESKSESTRARPTPKPADDESAKPLKHRIRDKVFVYHRNINMWIDEAYRKETMEFRLLRLERGSKAYEDVLAKDPQLREFFDHGPILVVWKNKIYRVK